MVSLPKVAIVECGGQLTLNIERTLRELGTRSVILAPGKAIDWIIKNQPRAVILSGGGTSVYDADAPKLPVELLSLCQADGHPTKLLGICYGLQWLAYQLGGVVEAVPGTREYGPAFIILSGSPEGLFLDTPELQDVWMSHGDTVTTVPIGFTVVARSNTGIVAAIKSDDGVVWGVQFHPEVSHTTHGQTMLANFLRSAGCEPDWKPTSMVELIRKSVKDQLGNRRAIFGFSGGVDSTTLAAILAPALGGDRLLAITIDGGQLREGELEEIREHARITGVKLRVIHARREFSQALAGTIDAEEKRRRFRKVYASIFVQAAEDFGATVVIQGTLAPDRIESGATGGALIKTHHNVGLFMGELDQLHPISHLYKYEVRALAREMGLPERICGRQPFPGPGLFLRVSGVPATPHKLKLVRWADARVREILVRKDYCAQISQLVVGLNGVKTVGVKGDARAYGYSIVVRAVETTDFMTARGIHFSQDVQDEIIVTLTKHQEIVRVWFDPTDKPPATTEFE